jgi:hypothetical protein
VILRLFILLCLALGVPQIALAQEMLSNRSFETPMVPADGNNFYATIPNWTIFSIAPAQTSPWNVIRPWSGYGGNPTATPAGGGIQYLDVNSAAGTIRQTVTIPSQGMVDFSGYFSVRDFPQALTGLTINIRDPGGAVVGTAGTTFAAADPIGLWKFASGANIPVGPGTYIFEVVIPDFANFDLASMVFKPALALTKSSNPLSDPVNGTTNPKFLAGGVAEYTISATTPASYSVTANTIALLDTTPVNTQLIVANIGGVGSGPAAFTPGSTGLTYSFTSLASTTDDIEFSNDGGTSWTYAPVADTNGADANVTTVRLRPKGTMAASATLSFKLRYRIK